MALFAITWSAATLFHIWGRSSQITDLAANWSTVGALQAMAGVAAIAVLVRPRARPPLLLLAALGPPSAWFEAPFLGNHWLLAAFVDIGLLLVYAARRAGGFEQAFVPVARWVLIAFYSFAAFAKLNHAFFTPEVSCATYYLDELAKSLHLAVHSQSGGGWTHLVPFVTAGIEVSIPFLLLGRRTRHIGVVVALGFHGAIALDQTHLFADFSSVLNALFLLFLPPAFASNVFAQVREWPPVARERFRTVVILGSTVLLVAQLYGRGDLINRFFFDGQGWAWVTYDAALIAFVIGFLWTRRPSPIESPLDLRRGRVPRWLTIVPALVILNGLSPYLELRTAYAFNMYSNLQTAQGETNHFLVTRTAPLADFQSDLVRISKTSDPGLQLYADTRFDLPFLQLRDYLSRHPDASLTYVRGGVERSVARAADDPALVEPVPSWESKLFAFRSLDQTQPGRCQPGFLPAL